MCSHAHLFLAQADILDSAGFGGVQEPATQPAALFLQEMQCMPRLSRGHQGETPQGDSGDSPMPNSCLAAPGDPARPSGRRQRAGRTPGHGKGSPSHGFSLSSTHSPACPMPGNFRLQRFSPEETLAIDLGIDIAK